ncbi:NAD(P)-binding protein [Hypoxylon sp. NC0597]|nr:NAD(P)-binding protein [Hypoxylon sp. NC0597]
MSGGDAENFPKITSFTATWHTASYPFISPSRPELSPVGRDVVITGGIIGIGNAIGVAFAQAGAKSVAIISRRLDNLKSEAATISAAISNGTETKVGGKIDVLVSNAGPAPETGLMTAVTDEQFLRTLGLRPHSLSPIPNYGLYSISLATLLKLTDYIQAENQYVRVINVQPGWVATETNGNHKEAPDSAALPGQFHVWLASPEAAFLKGTFVWAN